jgi:hypothetical protein
MANEQLKQCERATDDVIVAAEEVRVLMKTLRCNEYGILHDPYDVQRDLRKAQQLISQAITVIGATAWPTKADYDTWAGGDV